MKKSIMGASPEDTVRVISYDLKYQAQQKFVFRSARDSQAQSEMRIFVGDVLKEYMMKLRGKIDSDFVILSGYMPGLSEEVAFGFHVYARVDKVYFKLDRAIYRLIYPCLFKI